MTRIEQPSLLATSPTQDAVPATDPPPATLQATLPARTPRRLHRAATGADRALLRLPGLPAPAFFDRSTRHATAWIWVTTRLAMLMAVGFGQETVVGDVSYYGRSLSGLFHGVPLRETLQEYPLPVFGVILPQFLIGGLNPLAFGLLFLASMLGVDAAFTAMLLRTRRRESPHGVQGARGAVGFWLWFVPLMGPIAYFRFDLVPAVFAGAAILSAVRRPTRSGVLVAFGAGLKLWPAALLPTFLVRRRERRRAVTGFLAAGVVILGVSMAVGGITRLLSPLRWQSARGLQIESIFAMPLMLSKAVHQHGTWSIHVSRYKAYEIFGAGVHAALVVSTLATVGGLLLLVLFWWRAWRMPVASIDLLGWLVLATVAVLTVINKTLSPQYVLWLGGPLAAMLLRTPRDVAVRKAATLLLVLAGLTQLIFPLTYSWLLGDSWTMAVSTVVLVARNILLIWLTWMAGRQVWRRTRPAAVAELPDVAELPGVVPSARA